MSGKTDLLIRLDSQFNDKGFKNAEQSAKILERELNKQEKAERDLANMQIAAQREAEARRAKQLAGYTQVGTAATLMGAAIAAGLGLAGKAAMDWETAWAGVTKTVNGSDAEMAGLEAQLRSLARTLPASHEEIAAVAEAAGQLGVKRQDIAKFTKTMIDLGVSTNLSSDEAATGLAQLGNVMGVLPSQADRAGASLVALGNDGASTERDILEMSLRIAGSGKVIGLTEAQVMGFANALASMGIDAEAGGSAISRVMVDVAKAVDEGGDSLTMMAKLAGMTGSQFKASFQKDAAGAIATMIGGLGKLDAAGGSSFAVLDKLGWGNIRVRDTMLRASQSGDLLKHSLELGSQAWKDNTALVNEANKRYETSASRVKIARNQLTDAAIDIGAVVLPAFAGAADRIGVLSNTFRELPQPVKEAVVILGGIAGAAALVGGAALIAVPKLMAMNATLAATGPAGAAAARGMSAIGGALMGPWGLALGAATVALGIWAEKQYQSKKAQDEMAASLDQQTGAITNSTRAGAAKKLQDDGLLEVARNLGLALSDVTDAAVGQGSGMYRVADAAKKAHDEYDALTAKARAGVDVDYDALTAAEARVQQFDRLSKATGDYRDQLAPAIAATKQKAEAVGKDADATSSAADASTAFAGSIDGITTTAEDAQKALDDLIKSVEEYGSTTLNAHAAARDYQQAIDDATDAIKKNKVSVNKARTEFNLNTEAGRKQQAALEDIATTALKSATANFENGKSVKSVTNQIVGKGGARDAFVSMATKMGLNKTAANKLADQLGLTKGNVDRLSTAINKTPTKHNTDMTVQTAAAKAKLDALQRHINGLRGNDIRINVRYVENGPRPDGSHSTAGGLTKNSATGNLFEFASGGYAPVGAMRPQVRLAGGAGMTWAEAGAGPWEAFISGNPANRDRSLDIWQDVGRRLGVLGTSAPQVHVVAAPDSGTRRVELGSATIARIASAIAGVQVHTTVSARGFDEALGAVL